METSQPQRIVFAGTDAYEGKLYVSDLDGSSKRTIAQLDDAVLFPCWNQDSIYFCVAGDAESDKTSSDYLVNPDGSRLRRLGVPEGMLFQQFINDGQRLLFSSGDGEPMVSVDLNGEDLQYSPAIAFDSLAADESKWIVVRQDEDGEDVYEVHYADGREPWELEDLLNVGGSVYWSPCSSAFLLVREDDEFEHGLYLGDSEAQTVTELEVPICAAMNARWSPDGTQVAMIGALPIDEESPDDEAVDPISLFIMDADGTNVRQLSQHETYQDCIAWSLDSKHVFVSEDLDDSDESMPFLHKYDVESGEGSVIPTETSVWHFALSA